MAAAVAVTLLLASASPASACPPPLASTIVAERNDGESAEAFYDRLAKGTSFSLYFVASPRQPGEGETSYVRRQTEFTAEYQKALERLRATQRANNVEVAKSRWQQAAQILLVKSERVKLRNDGNGETKSTRFKVLERRKGLERFHTFWLSYPSGITSCGPQYPSFDKNRLYVIFAKSGPIEPNSIVAFFDSESALEDATLLWLKSAEAPQAKRQTKQR